MPDDDKGPLDQALDILVFLPLGAVLELPSSIPRFIDRGRRELDLLRGRGRKGQLSRLQDHTRGTLRALGVVQGDGAEPRERAEARPPAPATPPPPPRVVPPDPGIDPESLAIPDYDSLSASQVVPRLDSLSTDELETVRQYENAKRGRKTILNKIAQLQTT